MIVVIVLVHPTGSNDAAACEGLMPCAQKKNRRRADKVLDREGNL
jgi:hypothetical protein